MTDLQDNFESARPAGERAITSRALIIGAVFVGLLARVIWSLRHGFALEQEGVEYTRIAENLLAGRGYVGIFANGTQLNFPPLYPIMIAGVSLVVGTAELAARVVNIAFGAALVIPVFRIAERVYGRRVAAVAAILAAIHPALIAGGASTYSEGPNLTLVMSAVLWLMIWVSDRRVRSAVVAGAFFGLAYLVRPEAFVMVGAFAAVGVLAALLSPVRRPVLLGVVGLVAAFGVVATPNIVFLTRSTGKLRIEAKGTLAYQWGQRINDGMSYGESVSAIGDDLSDQGVFMRPNLEVINSTPPTARQYAVYLLKAARRNFGEIHHTIVDEPAFGSPILFVLVVLGLFASRWDRRRVALEGILLATAALLLFVLLSVQELWFRYFFALLGLLLIWGAKGADHLFEWGRGTVGSFTADSRIGTSAGALLQWTALAAVLMYSLRAVPELSQFKESEYKERVAAGRWLAPQGRPQKWIMETGLQVTYYAKGNLILLPYAKSDLAIRYIEKRKPDYIVLHGDSRSFLPYTAQWFDSGIPDERAVLVYDNKEVMPHDRIKIFRWAAAAR